MARWNSPASFPVGSGKHYEEQLGPFVAGGAYKQGVVADPTIAAAAVNPELAGVPGAELPSKQRALSAAAQLSHLPGPMYIRKPTKREGRMQEYDKEGTDLYVKWLPFEATLYWLVEKLDQGGFPVARDSRKKPLLTVWRSARPGHEPKPGTAQLVARVQAKVRIQVSDVDPREVQRHLSSVCECETRVDRSHQEGWREPEVRPGVHLRFYWSQRAAAEGKCTPLQEVEDVLREMAGRVNPTTGKAFLSTLRGLVCLCITSSKHSEQPDVGRMELAGEFTAEPRYSGMPQEKWEQLSKDNRDELAKALAEDCRDSLNEVNIGWYIACVDYSDGVTQLGRLKPNGPVLTRDKIINHVQERLRAYGADWLKPQAGAAAAEAGRWSPGPCAFGGPMMPLGTPAQLQYPSGAVSSAGSPYSAGPSTVGAAGPAGSLRAGATVVSTITGSAGGSLAAGETAALRPPSPGPSTHTASDTGDESLFSVDATESTTFQSIEAALLDFNDCGTPRKVTRAPMASVD
eukprot:TRINITY_DN31204_c0_g1_i1.p1 TRINITY_DN31204_c0_g1~~TRINITY_DN31204_c0_g1_i1.p1  ORF type:complete len:567 (+),score=87.80 TRINITY_DN31204_c0_g1_i1:151-1701(+)